MNFETKIKYWSTGSVFDQETRDEINNLIIQKNTDELLERFAANLSFGTGGIRGIVGAGSARMNVYNIRKATYALVKYAQKYLKKDSLKLAISYDTRKTSWKFASSCAEVAAAYGVTCYITKESRPTPMLSYMVREYDCDIGICITASHNPENYNGFKAYWNYGGQLVTPHDTGVIEIFNELELYENIKHIKFESAVSDQKIFVVAEDFDQKYFEKVSSLSLNKSGRNNYKIVFSPLHGCGGYPIEKSLKNFGFKDIFIVAEQSNTDGNFTTLSYPNPEDPKSFNLALKLGKQVDADIILATDLDGDRLGIMSKVSLNENHYEFLNGNEIIALLTDYILSEMSFLNRDFDKTIVVKTIVTSDLVRSIATKYGVETVETLTGFKWIGALIELQASLPEKMSKKYLCGGEESYGFLFGDFVRDKDGVSACCIASEMGAVYKSKGLSLRDRLNQLYQEHGFYKDELVTIELPGLKGQQQIQDMMKRLRSKPPLQISNFNIIKVKDFLVSQEFSVENQKKISQSKLELPASDVLQLILDDGSNVSVRPSGTEPKIKIYLSVRQSIEDANGNFKLASELADEKLQKIKNDILLNLKH